MDQALLSRLTSLPRLDRKNATSGLPLCKVCGAHSRIFDVVDLNKSGGASQDAYRFGLSGIMIPYFACDSCGFVFTTFFDEWTVPEFARFIYNDDYKYVDVEYDGPRPKRVAGEIADRLAGHQQAHILDYGSGAGIFADALKARGFGMVDNYDPFSSPSKPQKAYDIVTCFEVIEHTTAPLQTLHEVRSLVRDNGIAIFSTGIQPPNIRDIRCNWWYVSPRNGHVSIYTLEALARLAQGVGMTFYAGAGLFALACERPSASTTAILNSIGKPFYFLELLAPGGALSAAADRGTTSDEADWHSIEDGALGRFRWTRNPSIKWRLSARTVLPCVLKIAIPFLMEIEDGFASGCRIQIDGRTYPVEVERQPRIVTTVTMDSWDSGEVSLLTPSPRRPSELRPVSDNRPLGIAITSG